MSKSIYRPFVKFLAPAKLNLGLKIVGKRADNYHLLNSVLCLVDMFDEINIQTTTQNKISVIEHNQAWHYKQDLVYKAAMLLKQHTNYAFGANIKNSKVIPSGAGLGGGSSDAATVLVALNQLWNLNLNASELLTIGAKLGADVPFFLNGYTAYVSGIGENMFQINLPELYFVIIMPSFHFSTKDVFNNLDFSNDHCNTNFSAQYLMDSLENDLIIPAAKLNCKILEILNFAKSYGKATMSGSGSALFIQFTEKKIAKKVAKELSSRYNTYLVKSLETSLVVS